MAKYLSQANNKGKKLNNTIAKKEKKIKEKNKKSSKK